MERDKTGLANGLAGGIPLAEAFHVPGRRRIDLDRRLANLTPEDPARSEVWQELEEMPEALHEVVRELASMPAVNRAELQAVFVLSHASRAPAFAGTSSERSAQRDHARKAAILVTLRRSEVGGGGQVIADPKRIALAVSITDDIASLSDG
jgi:hypothetical protein